MHDSPEGSTAGCIIGAEAYLARHDGASDSENGPRSCNASMSPGPGYVDLYRIDGTHLFFNIVTAMRDVGEAVLVRVLGPLAGLELIGQWRQRSRGIELRSGPGRLAQALDLAGRQGGMEWSGTGEPSSCIAGLPAHPRFTAGVHLESTRARPCPSASLLLCDRSRAQLARLTNSRRIRFPPKRPPDLTRMPQAGPLF